MTQENIKEFSLEDFFGGFFHLFYSIPIDFFTKHTIESLIEIRFKLKEDSAFFSHLVYTTDIWFNLDFEIQNFYWDYIKEIYSQDPNHYLQSVGIDKLLQIIKHLTSSKRGPCWEKHRDINDKRFARKSTRHLPATKISEYINPILRLIKNILSENAKEKYISSWIWELATWVVYRAIPCFKIAILKVLIALVSDEEPNAAIFKSNLKEEKHYFLILKTFHDSYYDVQTYWAQIIKVLELEQSIKEKIFSFMNYVVCPPEQRDHDVNLEDVNAYHSPVFKNEVRNILDQSEELKEQRVMSKFGITPKMIGPPQLSYADSIHDKIVVDRRDSRYLHELKVGFKDPEPLSTISDRKENLQL